jgi:Tfp pilus assembly protein PilN
MKLPFPSKSTPGSFLPQDYVTRKTEQRAGFLSLALFSVVMFGVCGAFLVTNRRWKDIRTQQAVIDTQYATEAKKIDQLKTLEDQRKAMMEKAEVVAALLEKVPRSVLLAEMVQNLPKGVSLTDVTLKSKRVEEKQAPVAQGTGQIQKVGTISGDGKTGSKPSAMKTKEPKAAPEKPKVTAPKFEFTLTIEGVATENNEIADYLSSLKQSELLESLDLQFIDESMVDEVSLRKFKMEAKLRQDVDVRHIQALLAGQDKTEQKAKEQILPGGGGSKEPEKLSTAPTAPAPAESGSK